MFQILYRNIAAPILDFIYPPLCFTCERLLARDERVVCTECWRKLSAVQSEHPTWIEHAERFQQEGVISGVTSCFLFEREGILQLVLHLLKYQGVKSLGVRLGCEIGARILATQDIASADGVIPVPLHKQKERERGYNQSDLLCKGISEVAGIPSYTSLIARTKYTQSQTKLNIDERKENVGNAFAVHPEFQTKIHGKTFILVDDVITTGSTMNACAQELRKCGASKIYAVSAALA